MRKRPDGEVANLYRTDQRRREVMNSANRRTPVAVVAHLVQSRLDRCGRRAQEQENHRRATDAVDVSQSSAADERGAEQKRRERENRPYCPVQLWQAGQGPD